MGLPFITQSQICVNLKCRESQHCGLKKVFHFTEMKIKGGKQVMVNFYHRLTYDKKFVTRTLRSMCHLKSLFQGLESGDKVILFCSCSPVYLLFLYFQFFQNSHGFLYFVTGPYLLLTTHNTNYIISPFCFNDKQLPRLQTLRSVLCFQINYL